MSEPLSRAWLPPRIVAGVATAASAAILATVFAMQYLGGLAPCHLCIAQRWPYGAAILCGAIALLPGVTGGMRRAALAAAGIAFLVTAALGAYHAGVEWKVFAGPSDCTGTVSAGTVEALKAQLMAAPVVRCDQVAWSLFGISLAGWNFIVATALAVLALASALRGRAA